MYRVKMRTTTILLVVIMFVIWSGILLPSSIAYSATIVLGVILFSVVSLIVSKKNIKVIDLKKNIDKLLIVFLWLIALGFAIAGLRFSMLGYIAIAGTIGIIFPAFYFTVDLSEDKGLKLFNVFINSIMASYIFFLLISFMLKPITELGYASFMKNPNFLGTYLTLVLVATLHKLNVALQRSDKKYMIYLVVLGSVIQFNIVSLSRTSTLAMCLIIGINVVVYIVCKQKINLNFKRILAILIIIAVGMSATFFVFSRVSYNLQEKTAWGVISKCIGNKLGLDKKDELEINYKNALFGFKDKSLKGLDGSGRFTSGRAEIWNSYVNALNFVGHAKEERHIVTKYYDYVVNAHNTYLQIAYSIGIFGGILFFLFVLIVSLRSTILNLQLLRKRKFDPVQLSVLGIVAAFSVNSLVAVGYSPFTYPVVFGFWFSLLYLIRKDKESISL